MSQLDIAEARTKLPELLVHSPQGRRSGSSPKAQVRLPNCRQCQKSRADSLEV